MAIRDAWAETEEEVTGEYVASNKPTNIPDGTECLSTIEGINWHSFAGSDHEIINIKWRVASGDYENRVIFQKVKINGEDPASKFYTPEKSITVAEKAEMMFRNIDKNGGGFVYALKRKPTDAELNKFLIGATMIVKVGVYNDNQFVQKVSPAPDAPTPKQKPVAKKATVFDDSDIPF